MARVPIGSAASNGGGGGEGDLNDAPSGPHTVTIGDQDGGEFVPITIQLRDEDGNDYIGVGTLVVYVTDPDVGGLSGGATITNAPGSGEAIINLGALWVGNTDANGTISLQAAGEVETLYYAMPLASGVQEFETPFELPPPPPIIPEIYGAAGTVDTLSINGFQFSVADKIRLSFETGLPVTELLSTVDTFTDTDIAVVDTALDNRRAVLVELLDTDDEVLVTFVMDDITYNSILIPTFTLTDSGYGGITLFWNGVALDRVDELVVLLTNTDDFVFTPASPEWNIGAGPDIQLDFAFPGGETFDKFTFTDNETGFVYEQDVNIPV